jgi:hypothetical protein
MTYERAKQLYVGAVICQPSMHGLIRFTTGAGSRWFRGLYFEGLDR